MRIVKILAFMVGLSLLTFLNMRHKDKPNEAYGFMKFSNLKEDDKASSQKEFININTKFKTDGSEGIDDGGGE